MPETKFLRMIAIIGFIGGAAVFIIFDNNTVIRFSGLLCALACSRLALVSGKPSNVRKQRERREIQDQIALTSAWPFRIALAGSLLIAAGSIVAMALDFGGVAPVWLVSIFGFTGLLMLVYLLQSRS